MNTFTAKQCSWSFLPLPIEYLKKIAQSRIVSNGEETEKETCPMICSIIQ